MKNSVSFNVDHSKLGRGIYLSKIDTLGNGIKTVTLDIRLREPYKEEILSNLALHTFEHCFATAIRDISEDLENVSVAYFGPMGCQTGFYLVVSLKNVNESGYFPFFANILKTALVYLEDMKEVPAKNELQCGYCYSLGEMADALSVAADIKKLVDKMIETNSFFKYTYL